MAGSHSAQPCRTFSDSLSSVLSGVTAAVSSRALPTLWVFVKQNPDLYRGSTEQVKSENPAHAAGSVLLHIQTAAHMFAFAG